MIGGGEHYTKVIQDCIELSIYSDGAISYQEAINMSADETHFLIYNFKKHFDEREKNKQDKLKAEYEYKNKALKQILDVLAEIANRMGRRPPNG